MCVEGWSYSCVYVIDKMLYKLSSSCLGDGFIFNFVSKTGKKDFYCYEYHVVISWLPCQQLFDSQVGQKLSLGFLIKNFLVAAWWRDTPATGKTRKAIGLAPDLSPVMSDCCLIGLFEWERVHLCLRLATTTESWENIIRIEINLLASLFLFPGGDLFQ